MPLRNNRMIILNLAFDDGPRSTASYVSDCRSRVINKFDPSPDSHTFLEIDHEIISKANLLPEGLSVTSESMCIKYCLNCLVKLAQEKVRLGELTIQT